MPITVAEAAHLLAEAPLADAVAALRDAEARLLADGRGDRLNRFHPDHRPVVLGRYGVASARVAALRRASGRAFQARTGAYGRNAFRWEWPSVLIIEAGEALADPAYGVEDLSDFIVTMLPPPRTVMV